MNTKESIAWFRQNFSAQLTAAVQGTPYTVELLCAIAYQETGHIWSRMIGKLPVKEIVRLCVGDIIDAPKRSAFPANKAALLQVANGQQMFDIARACFEEMAEYITEYKPYVKNKNKFCHGYGIFQYDLQHFKTDPQYFLQQEWANVDLCFGKCIKELKEAQARQGWAGKTALSNEEKVYVAIAYNRGRADLKKGFKQGFFDGKKYYGECVFEYLMLAQSLRPGPAAPGAPIPDPTPVPAGKKVYKVVVRDTALNLRDEPKIPSLIKTRLPAGHLVNWISGKKSDGWYQVETTLNGAYFKGYASSDYLTLVQEQMPEALTPSADDPVTGVVAAHLPVKAGVLTRRAEPANARSLNEAGQPVRNKSAMPAELVQSLLKIIDWLDVTNPRHKRYQPGDGKTFCNIYVHDYCRLAGVYFPRVWWTQGALLKLAAGEQVAPLYDDTVVEVQANNLFRWMRDFGPRFGWRQTGDLNKLQQAANLGAVAIIIGRRVAEKGPGHVVAIAPETDIKARRDAHGNVTLPVQSQAGAGNVKLGTIPAWWLNSEKFAEYAFWIHS
jgi:hypothetical protein